MYVQAELLALYMMSWTELDSVKKLRLLHFQWSSAAYFALPKGAWIGSSSSWLHIMSQTLPKGSECPFAKPSPPYGRLHKVPPSKSLSTQPSSGKPKEDGRFPCYRSRSSLYCYWTVCVHFDFRRVRRRVRFSHIWLSRVTMHSPKLSAKRVNNSQFHLRGNRMQSQFYFPYNFTKRRSAYCLDSLHGIVCLTWVISFLSALSLWLVERLSNRSRSEGLPSGARRIAAIIRSWKKATVGRRCLALCPKARSFQPPPSVRWALLLA